MAAQRAAGGIGGLILIIGGVLGVVGTNVLFADTLRADAEAAASVQTEEHIAAGGLEDETVKAELSPKHALHTSYGTWEVTISYPTRGHNDDVLAADKFNDPRLVGEHWEWVLARVEITNTGDTNLSSEDLDVILDIGDGPRSAHENMGNLVVHQKLPNEMRFDGTIIPGDTITGNIGWFFSHEDLDASKAPRMTVTLEQGGHTYLGDVTMTDPITTATR